MQIQDLLTVHCWYDHDMTETKCAIRGNKNKVVNSKVWSIMSMSFDVFGQSGA